MKRNLMSMKEKDLSRYWEIEIATPSKEYRISARWNNEEGQYIGSIEIGDDMIMMFSPSIVGLIEKANNHIAEYLTEKGR